jgi:hypothetical protein
MANVIGLLIVILFFPAISIAGHISLSTDANGWTIFAPSADTRICYVDPTTSDGTGTYWVWGDGDVEIGSDPFNPAGNVDPYPTIAEAVAVQRDGYPDWILIKRGETITEFIDPDTTSGRDEDEPRVLGSYGASGASPIIRSPLATNEGLRFTNSISYMAIFGLDFYNYLRDPDNGGSFTSGSSGFLIVANDVGELFTSFLIEGCKFRFYQTNTNLQATDGNINYITYRRNVLLDSYDEDDHSQGIYTTGLDNFVFEENILVHNGWYKQQYVGNNNKAEGQATVYNHNIYWGAFGIITIEKNLIIDGASGGIKLTASAPSTRIDILNNLLIGNEIALSIGYNYDGLYRMPNTDIYNNVITRTGHLFPTDRTLAWGIAFSGLDGGEISNNLLINPETDTDSACIKQDTSSETSTAAIARNINVTNNTFFNYGSTAEGALYINAKASGSSGMVFSANKIQLPDLANTVLNDFNYDVSGEWSFDTNTWFADSTTWDDNGTPVESLEAWNALSFVGTDTWSEYSFTDDTRDVDTYMTSIGETGTIDAFIASVRAQDRYDWDSRLEADTVNDWIRTGFDLSEYSDAPRRKSFSATGNCLGTTDGKCFKFGN